MTRGHEGVTHNQHEVQLQFQFSCYLDGSWSGTWQGGIRYLFYKGDSLVTYEARGVSSCCAIQAEAQALLTAMQTAVKKGMLSTVFYTDCQELAKACNSINPPLHSDWRAFHETFEAWRVLRKNTSFQISHISRSQNDLADKLAKHGRMMGNN